MALPELSPIKTIQLPADRPWTNAELFTFLTLMRDVPWRVLSDRSIMLDGHTQVMPGSWVVWHSALSVDIVPDAKFQAWYSSFSGTIVKFNEPDEDEVRVQEYNTDDGEEVEAVRMSPTVRKADHYLINTTLPYLLRHRGTWSVVHSSRLVMLRFPRYDRYNNKDLIIKLGIRDWLVRTKSGLLQVYPHTAFKILFNRV